MIQRDFHFVALVGSLRRASYSRAIAATLDELAPDDVAVRLLGSVGEFPHYSEDTETTGIPAMVIAMGTAIAEAGAVVIVTPEYNHSIPGALKNALDWLSRLSVRPFEHKPVAFQSASPGQLGGSRAHEHLRQVLASMDAFILNKPEIIVPRVAEMVDPDNGVVRDEETRRRIGLQLRALTDWARQHDNSRTSEMHEGR